MINLEKIKPEKCKGGGEGGGESELCVCIPIT